MTHRPSRLTVFRASARLKACGCVAICTLLAWPSTAHAQSPAGLYATVYGQETAVRSGPAPTVASLRAVVSAYERVVRKYPSSAYSDNSLWQAAGVAALAYETFGDAKDLEAAERLLKWLKQEYPSSSLVKQVPARIAALHAPVPTASPSVLPAVLNTTPAPATAAPAPPANGRANSGPTAVVKSITHTALPRGDRITIELSDEVSYSGDRIVSPDRIYFDFRNASAPASVAQQAAALNAALSGRLIKTLRVGQPVAGTARLTMELTDYPRYSVFPMYQPFRLVIDVERVLPAPAQMPVLTPTPAAPATSRANSVFVPAAFPTPHPPKPTSTPTPQPTPVIVSTTPIAPPMTTPIATPRTKPSIVV